MTACTYIIQDEDGTPICTAESRSRIESILEASFDDHTALPEHMLSAKPITIEVMVRKKLHICVVPHSRAADELSPITNCI